MSRIAFALMIGQTAASQNATQSASGVISSCEWHVAPQLLYVQKPSILAVDVEKHCPYSRHGAIHDRICEKCASLDNECGGTFAACVGCCDLSSHQRSHSCEQIKKFLFAMNSKKILCDSNTADADGEVSIQTNDSEMDSDRTLSENCECPMDEIKRPIPVKLGFDCSSCAQQGDPDLLDQCCDHGREFFKNSELAMQMREDGYRLFLWLDGCHDEYIGPNKIYFPHTRQHKAYQQDEVDNLMEQFINEKYCTIMDTHPDNDRCPRRLGENWSVSPSRNLQDTDCPWAWWNIGLTGPTTTNSGSDSSGTDSTGVRLTMRGSREAASEVPSEVDAAATLGCVQMLALFILYVASTTFW